MRKTLLVAAFFLMVSGIIFSQQDPMFTKYMFNSMIYNPGYAGSKDYMYIGLLHRTQWYEINGAPTTQSFTIHTPLKQERVGVGFSVINDIIGPTNTIGANLVYSYRIPIGNGKLSFGLQGGLENYRADWTKLEIEEPDPAFDYNPNLWLPNFGAGIYYYTNRFYAGFSSPHLVEYDLRTNTETTIYARQVRHYFFTVGGAILLNGKALVFRPSLLVKNVGLFKSKSKLEAFKDIGAPTEFDIDISFLMREVLWVGASFRSAIEAFGSDKRSSFDSADAWVSWRMNNGMRIGVAYDYPLTELSDVTVGAFEIMLGYEFHFRNKKIATPRYF